MDFLRETKVGRIFFVASLRGMEGYEEKLDEIELRTLDDEGGPGPP